MNRTKIEWTDLSVNPIRAQRRIPDPEGVHMDDIGVGHYCEKISPGCKNCYASQMQPRFKMATFDKADLSQLEVYLDEDVLQKVLRRRKPARIFWCDMTDMFGSWVPDEWLDQIFAVMALTPHLTHQVLTKRPERMRTYVSDPEVPFRIAKQIDALTVKFKADQMKYELRPIPWAEHYFIDNTGQVFTDHGSGHCVWCGTEFSHGQQDSIYCSHKCGSAVHYAKSKGMPPEPAGRSVRAVKLDVADLGYARFRIKGLGRELVHRAVLRVFDRESEEDEVTRHIDGDPTNNHICNLRWGSVEQNLADRWRHGNGRSWAKLTREQVDSIRLRYTNGETAQAIAPHFDISDTQVYNIVQEKQHSTKTPLEWPLGNCWLGVSVENQEQADKRIRELQATPAALRFLSLEPLLEPVDLSGWLTKPRWGEIDPQTNLRPHEIVPRNVLHWVIGGGESGPNARPMRPDWARSIRDQCAAAGVPFFFKQWGAWGEASLPDKRLANLDRNGGVIWDQGIPIVARVGKKAAGRLLDGREHNEMPEVRP